MRTIKYAVAVGFVLFPVLFASGQQAQISETRHPGDHLHYTVALADGDVNKIVNVQVTLHAFGDVRLDQPNGQTRIMGGCSKSSDPKVWNCDVMIAGNVVSGNYRLDFVQVQGPEPTNFFRNYDESFPIPIVRVENPNTFTAPSKVTVKQNP